MTATLASRAPYRLAALIAGVVAATSFTACSRRADEDTRAARDADRAVAQADQARQDVREGAAEARRDINDAAADAQNAVNDAAITASINAKLAGDNELGATKIDVDTVGGKVALTGTAPNESARERATQIASSVSGVKSVDNQLTVNG